jgi:hypothetical protein
LGRKYDIARPVVRLTLIEIRRAKVNAFLVLPPSLKERKKEEEERLVAGRALCLPKHRPVSMRAWIRGGFIFSQRVASNEFEYPERASRKCRLSFHEIGSAWNGAVGVHHMRFEAFPVSTVGGRAF